MFRLSVRSLLGLDLEFGATVRSKYCLESCLLEDGQKFPDQRSIHVQLIFDAYQVKFLGFCEV